MNDAEAVQLQSHRRPIVLLTIRPGHSVAPEVAPDYTTLGFMLPYTPLHHLLLHHFAQELAPRQPAILVMTIREQSGLQVVALSGGVFQNRLLLEQLMARLREMAFRVYINRRVPPNDGGISFGQIAVAAA